MDQLHFDEQVRQYSMECGAGIQLTPDVRPSASHLDKGSPHQSAGGPAPTHHRDPPQVSAYQVVCMRRTSKKEHQESESRRTSSKGGRGVIGKGGMRACLLS
ncbi:uncharacterized protein LOC122367460 [Amphibalanus amphitrite]|uniref:uncharacterized protein LOC122367460 n=1 Tax=Amphibalanus amphitrite TaxID=1232801 RepID=UPI001C90864B|nr:uncharacterized protein LOC122367460 [Amphibalanus amphitrite]